MKISVRKVGIAVISIIAGVILAFCIKVGIFYVKYVEPLDEGYYKITDERKNDIAEKYNMEKPQKPRRSFFDGDFGISFR